MSKILVRIVKVTAMIALVIGNQNCLTLSIKYMHFTLSSILVRLLQKA